MRRQILSYLSQVLFRYALAVFKYLEEELLQHADYMAIFHTLRSSVDKLNDVRKLTQVSEEGKRSDKLVVDPLRVSRIGRSFTLQSDMTF